MKLPASLVLLCIVSLPAAAQTTTGPRKGALLVAGGGALGADIGARFLELAGGPEARIVLIPTADGKDSYDAVVPDNKFLKDAGFRHVVVLHTKD